MSTKRNRGNVFTLLLENYIKFTLALVIILCLLFTFFILRSYKNIMAIDFEQILMNEQILASGDYNDFPTEKLLGKKGFIAVLDSNNKTVYNQRDFNINLSQEELAYIPDYALLSSTTVTQLRTKDGTINYQISYEHVNNDNEDTVTDTYILDENYNLIYASGDYLTSNLTTKEYKLITQSYFEGYHVSKYSFKNSNNQNYTLLLFKTQDVIYTLLDRVIRSIFDCILLFLLFYCFMIFCFSLWLKHKITKPLQLLCFNLNNFKVGAEIRSNYYGPKEFQEIFDSFSTMAARLENSENVRKKLEADKQKMLADIAHDLKTPITVVQGYAKALSDGVIPVEEQKKYFDTIEKKADGLNQLINTFYEYNKLEHPDYQFNFEKIDICNYLRDYIAEKYSELEAAGFIPNVEIPENHIMCNADKIQLKRAFENVVSNAVKHNPKKTEIYFNLEEKENYVTITLGDTGVGIPNEVSKNIFEPFIVGEISRNNHGSGLGLSIAKKIIEVHGGKISLLQDTPLYKTAFEITLPIIK